VRRCPDQEKAQAGWLACGWGNLSIERQRIIARKVLRTVVIQPAQKPRRPVDAVRTEPVFYAA
jgi:hypothetical protein